MRPPCRSECVCQYRLRSAVARATPTSERGHTLGTPVPPIQACGTHHAISNSGTETTRQPPAVDVIWSSGLCGSALSAPIVADDS